MSARKRQELIDLFEIERDASGGGELEPDFNVAPTKPVPAILTRETRELWIARWGLVPAWAEDVSVGARLINARLETAAGKPVFRGAFARRRCLLPADGYYEWRTRERPYFIHAGDGGVLAMAGLYEVWRRAGEELLTCTILTTAANDDVREIHDRMPVFVEPDSLERWLDPALTDPDEVRSLLMPTAVGRLTAIPVSMAVNKVTNNGPGLVTAVARTGISPDTPLTLF